MLFTKKQKVDERIVIVLGHYGPLLMHDLFTHLNKQFGSISTKSVYQEVAKLRTQGVLVIANKRISLREDWIKKLEQFYSKANASLTEVQDTILETLHNKGKIQLKASSLAQLGELWSNTLLLLTSSLNLEVLLEAVEHPWWILTNEDVEKGFLREIQRRRISYFLLMTTSTKLNKEYKKTYAPDKGEILFHSALQCVDEKYYSVVDNILVRVRIPQNIDTLISDCFSDNLQNLKNYGRFNRLQNAKGKFGLHISLEPRLTNRIKYEFSKIFEKEF